MTKKHFVKLAVAVKGIANPEEKERVAELLADVCQQVNPRFDRTIFYMACGL